MKFLLRQYWTGITARKALLGLILIPLAAYLLIASYLPSSYLITQAVQIGNDVPVAVASSPVDVRSVSETVVRADEFFRNVFAARELDALIESSEPNENLRVRSILSLVGAHMRMEIPSTGRVRISYLGDDTENGKILVQYFAHRLIQKAAEGRARVLQLNPPIQSGTISISEPVLEGLQVEPQKEFWNKGRIVPLLWVGVLSLVGILCLIGILEMSDPSFKSERQLAQYLNCPLLGSLPNLSELSAELDRRRS